MKKLLFLLFSLASLSSCQASWIFDNRTPLDKCLGAATLLLGTLSNLDNIKDRDSVGLRTDMLNNLKKDLKDAQDAQNLHNIIVTSWNSKEAIQLLKNNPNLHINARFGTYKQTSLMRCCYDGDGWIDVVKDILKHPKLDITVKDKEGWTCLYYACCHATKNEEIGGHLLARKDIGKIINEITHDNQTPLDMLYHDIKTLSPNLKRINLWHKMVRQGAVLRKYKYKRDYNKLKRSNTTHSLVWKSSKTTYQKTSRRSKRRGSKLGYS